MTVIGARREPFCPVRCEFAKLTSTMIMIMMRCSNCPTEPEFAGCCPISMHFISCVCVAYYKLRTAFQMNRFADVLTSHHSHTSSVPHVSSSLATSHLLIHPWITAERSYRVWKCKTKHNSHKTIGNLREHSWLWSSIFWYEELALALLSRLPPKSSQSMLWYCPATLFLVFPVLFFPGRLPSMISFSRQSAGIRGVGH